MYNKYIASIKKDECMDCGSKDIRIVNKDENKIKVCNRCGKAYYI